MQEHLPFLTSFLIQCLNDSRALIRSIACWALGRYSAWCVMGESTAEHKQKYFVPALEGLLRMVLDGNKRVQEAGCSAFATLEEEAQSELEPYLAGILQNLVHAFTKYQQKNLMILYDAIGTLADSVGVALNEPTLINILMPPLIDKWQKLTDDDPGLIPLLECMSSVVIALGPGFEPFAHPVFERCVRIIHSQLVAFQAFCASPETADQPDKTFLVVALDLLSGLTQGLATRSGPLYENSQPPVFPLLQFCLTVRLRFSAAVHARSTPRWRSGNRRTRLSATVRSQSSRYSGPRYRRSCRSSSSRSRRSRKPRRYQSATTQLGQLARLRSRRARRSNLTSSHCSASSSRSCSIPRPFDRSTRTRL